MLSYQTVPTATDEEFKALTSLTKTAWEELLKGFANVLEDSFQTPGTPHRGRPANLLGSGDKLGFILFYLKNYPRKAGARVWVWFGPESSQSLDKNT